ncbi:MAG: L-threonine 3-dehydrogenase [Sphingomonadales bacterium]
MKRPKVNFMRALVKNKAERGVWMMDQPIPEVAPNEVLIKIKKTAICGTDMHIYNWDKWAEKNIPIPLVTGHEFGGEIVELGCEVNHLKVGQRVTGEGHIIGETSRNVRAGKFHLDPETKGVGVNRTGAFAEYLSLPAFNVIQLPDDISLDTASIMDPLGNAVHAALSFDLIGEDVLITGAGPIGIMAAAVARHVGARNVILTDVNDYRLTLAAKIADVRPVNVLNEDLKDVMTGVGMREGFDVGLEMSGVASAFESMVNNMIMGGKIAMLGIPPGRTEVNFGHIIMKALNIKAIYGREMFETWYKMMAMLQSGLYVDGIITHRFSINNFEEGFSVMGSGKSGKVVLDWD